MSRTLLVLALQLALVSSASAQGWFSSFWQKLDSHEAGTWDVLEELEQPSINTIRMAIRENDRVTILRRRGARVSLLRRDRLFCLMLSNIAKNYGRKNFGLRQTISMPRSLRWRAHYIRTFEALAAKIGRFGHCKHVPRDLLSEVHLQAINYKVSIDRYVKQIEARTKRRRGSGWAGTLSAEIPGIPLKFEIVNGKLTLKLGGSFGGMKFDGQVGRSSSKTGIRLLRIVSATNIAFYKIDSVPIRFEIPASTLEFDGDMATVIYRAPTN
ncbi:MAG: hypothetical protein AAFQ10_00035 [Pseudomonadota bacterium]